MLPAGARPCGRAYPPAPPLLGVFFKRHLPYRGCRAGPAPGLRGLGEGGEGLCSVSPSRPCWKRVSAPLSPSRYRFWLVTKEDGHMVTARQEPRLVLISVSCENGHLTLEAPEMKMLCVPVKLPRKNPVRNCRY